MLMKRLPCPQRLRIVPPQFSWVDHRLVRDHHFERCDTCAWALYLFLITVADAQGVSYYANTRLSKQLGIDPPRLEQARIDLIQAGLIAYEPPFYQVLDLEGLHT